ncbi:MAG: hypothetical protein COV59_02085 [Candidatus Magasanikbacteria bacterium CG11_big_fil_rev_8_21_14_0_20_39_34]|uniref:Uncharacterized protein n=1 Tax=Candidatus Magasanikbacteria bacterium CG11_big_fil_rev_8_21_14_0_20_39_34 TaxID=1974653 RepID=A0A2H0N4X2_9BACT|nr:MAG: hypothetical protein COV59_02085 [Candidatus Magasanikbacteria bacterium CG11_big_fil_rev_8_21_14_0_20_39_34]
MSEYILTQSIIEKSESNTWGPAKNEWELDSIFDSDEQETCACGHFPIKEVCVLRNIQNQNSLNVGNCCVKKFMKNIDSDKIFRAKKKVMEDITNAFNEATIMFAHKKGWLNDWEKKFYLDTWRKRKPTENQLKKRVIVNRKILTNLNTE